MPTRGSRFSTSRIRLASAASSSTRSTSMLQRRSATRARIRRLAAEFSTVMSSENTDISAPLLGNVITLYTVPHIKKPLWAQVDGKYSLTDFGQWRRGYFDAPTASTALLANDAQKAAWLSRAHALSHRQLMRLSLAL